MLNLHIRVCHSADRCSGIGQNLSGDDIEAENVCYGEHHGDVFDIDPGSHVSRGDRRDHDLWETIGQSPHDLRAQSGSLRATERYHSMHLPLG